MSRLELRLEGESHWWLDGPYGSVKFDSERAVDLFVRVMSEGPDALKDHLLSGTVFSVIKSGNVDVAELFFAFMARISKRVYCCRRQCLFSCAG